MYITRVSVNEVIRDQRVFGVETQRTPFWMAGDGGQVKYDLNDLSGLSYKIKDILKKNESRRIRITTDVLSSLLILNPPETIYRFLAQLFSELKH